MAVQVASLVRRRHPSVNGHTASDTATISIAKASSTTTATGDSFTYDGTTHTGGSAVVSGAGVVTGSAVLSYSGDQVEQTAEAVGTDLATTLEKRAA